MDEVPPAIGTTQESVGDSLRAGRERLGLGLADVAARTRIPLRHLQAIEKGDYASLPSPTYATGFVRAYARVVGIDEVGAARKARGELARVPRQPDYQPYEAPDPARVPSRGLAIVGLGLALALIVLAGLWFAGMLTPAATNTAPPPDTVNTVPAAAPPAGTPAPTASATPVAPTAAGDGQVTLATTSRVWLRVHDGDKTLYLGTMAPGEHFDVPVDATNPLVDVGRPDKLQVALNGSILPALPSSDHPMKDLRVSAAAVEARLHGTTAPTAGPSPTASAIPDADRPRERRRTADRPRRERRPADDTARANLDAARNPPSPGNSQ